MRLPDEEAEEAREGLVQEKGFFILPSELFSNVCARVAQDENLNETLERVFRHHAPGRCGAENQEIPDRQQLFRLHYSTAGQPVFRHFHRNLHHGLEKGQA